MSDQLPRPVPFSQTLLLSQLVIASHQIALQRQNNSAVRISVLRDEFHRLALVSSPYFIEEPLEIRAAAHLSLLALKTIE